MGKTETFNQRERRYRLDRPTAKRVLRTLAQHLPIQRYADDSMLSIVVTTYFDTDDRHYLRVAEDSDGARSIKVRVREYLWRPADRADAPLRQRTTAFLERKERTGEIRLKQRVELDKRAIQPVLRRAVRLGDGSAETRALDDELDIRPLRPVLVSVYERVVYGVDDDLRITFDQRLGYYRPPRVMYTEPEALAPDVLGPALARGPSRILELKYAHQRALPPWLEAMLDPVPTANRFSKFRQGMRELSGSDGTPVSLTRPIAAYKG